MITKDTESLGVLKDTFVVSIFWAHRANGEVVVTTKKEGVDTQINIQSHMVSKGEQAQELEKISDEELVNVLFILSGDHGYNFVGLWIKFLDENSA